MSKLVQNLKRFQLVTFDITDTLLKFTLPPAVQYAKTAAQFGYPNIDQNQLNQNFKIEFKKLTKKYPNFGSEHYMDYKKWWFELVCNIFDAATDHHNKIPSNMIEKIACTLIHQYRTPECWEKIDGADEIVDKIKKSNKTIGIITNSDPGVCKVVNEMISTKFDFILTSYEIGYMKPHKNIFNEALKLCPKCKYDTASALHIGNTFEADYIGAQESGWCCLLISKESEIKTDPKLKHETHVYNSLRDLLGNLENRDIIW